MQFAMVVCAPKVHGPYHVCTCKLCHLTTRAHMAAVPMVLCSGCRCDTCHTARQQLIALRDAHDRGDVLWLEPKRRLQDDPRGPMERFT